jgi:gas vesicle protein
MDKQLLQNLSAKERQETLKDSADRIEEFSYTKPFTPEQIRVFKDDLSTGMIELNQLEDELKAIKDQFKARMKPMKQETRTLLTNIKNKAEFVCEKCFVMIEGNEAGYYNADGILVYQRPLLPGEAKTVFSVLREGTNG